MNYEKSCGAVIYRRENDELKYLLIFNKKGNAEGHWGFPKGHVENGESEEQTAQREIFEEVGITAKIDTKFRYVTRYSPKPDVDKDAVYFVAEVKDENVLLQESEVADMRWCCYEEGKNLLTYDSKILAEADKYIKNGKINMI
ncbi:MAG: NUDIX domain-containing protein [Clostridia bacterium]|nr:NUDIX domain-containing protein [Clostridia bacterium]